MSNRRKLKAEKAKRIRCPKCMGIPMAKEYKDGFLYICGRCQFPWRVER